MSLATFLAVALVGLTGGTAVFVAECAIQGDRWARITVAPALVAFVAMYAALYAALRP